MAPKAIAAITFALVLLLLAAPGESRYVAEKIVIAERIYFKADQSTISPLSAPIIDLLAQYIHANPSLRMIRIEGHSDGMGSESGGKELAEARAHAVRDALVRADVEYGRLTVAGMPPVRKLGRHGSDGNRYVSFRIVKRSEDPLFALVADDAWLHTRPSADSPRARFHDLEGVMGPARLARSHVFRFVDRGKEWVSLESPGPVAVRDHCSARPLRLDAYALQLFVRTELVRSVTRHTVRRRFDDGTSVVLAPGVTLARPRTEGKVTKVTKVSVIVDGMYFDAELPSAAVGYTYAASSHVGLRGSWRKRGMLFKSVSLDAAPRLAGGNVRYYDPMSGWPSVFAVRGKGESVFAKVVGDCSELDLGVSADDLDPHGVGKGSGSGMSLAGSPRVSVPEGAAVFWSDGSHAGVSRSKHVLGKSTERPGADGRRCFTKNVTDPDDTPGEGAFSLCFDASVLTDLP